MDGIELAARFSFITNSLRFCGPEEASGQFVEYIKSSASAESVKESLKKFEGLYPYLSSIAQLSKKDFCDYEVVEAYWIGNKLLELFDEEGMKEIIQKLMQRGLPKSIGMPLIEKMPKGMVPHHNFNVFYVGVGNTSGKVPTTLQNMENCMISWGKVVDFHGNNLVVETISLSNEDGKLSLNEANVKTAVYMKEMISPKKDDYVAFHWGFAPYVLNEKQLENLKRYTNLVINKINNSIP